MLIDKGWSPAAAAQAGRAGRSSATPRAAAKAERMFLNVAARALARRTLST